MKQTVEEAANEYCRKHIADLTGFVTAVENGFKAGAEWMLEQLSVIKLPFKLMPEAGINLENGQILATTDDCIIFYGNGKCDTAYREWTEDTGWRWKVKYGPAIEDDKVLFWMWNNLKKIEYEKDYVQ